MKFLLAISLLVLSTAAEAAPATASVFDKDSRQELLLFKWKREEPATGEILVTFLNLDTTVATMEEARADGIHVKSYDLDHRQLGEKGSLRVEGKKVHFSYTKAGKTETATEDWEESLVVGPTLIEYLKAHWAEILKGDTVSVRWAALDRKETVGFKFFKVNEKTHKGTEVVVVKMKPSSFIIAAIVDPIYLTMRKSDGRLLNLVGRTIAKRKVGDGWKDLDVEIEYAYADEAKRPSR